MSEPVPRQVTEVTRMEEVAGHLFQTTSSISEILKMGRSSVLTLCFSAENINDCDGSVSDSINIIQMQQMFTIFWTDVVLAHFTTKDIQAKNLYLFI